MHGALEDLRVPHEYQEVAGVGHDVGRLYRAVGSAGFRFSAAAWR